MSITESCYALILALLLSPPCAGQVQAQVWVDGYYRDDGTYVEGHLRTEPDGSPYNNYSYPGNYNPNTGEITPGNPETYLDNYYDREDVRYDYQPDYDYESGWSYDTEDWSYDSEDWSYDSEDWSYDSGSGRFYEDTTPTYAGKSEVVALQKALNLLGHDPGVIDGVYGPSTKRAVRSFQRSADIQVDGVVGDETVNHLVAALERLKTSGSSHTPSSSTSQVFRDAFAISYPSGWSADQSASWQNSSSVEFHRLNVLLAPDDAYYAELDGRLTKGIRIVLERLAEPISNTSSLEGIRSSIIQSVLEVNPGYELSDSTRVEISGESGMAYSLRGANYSSTPKSQKSTVYVVVTRNYLLRLTAISPSEEWESSRELFGQIVGSLDVVHPRAPK